MAVARKNRRCIFKDCRRATKTILQLHGPDPSGPCNCNIASTSRNPPRRIPALCTLLSWAPRLVGAPKTTELNRATAQEIERTKLYEARNSRHLISRETHGLANTKFSKNCILEKAYFINPIKSLYLQFRIEKVDQ